MAAEVPLEKLRAWWFRRQALDGSLTGPAEVLTRTGWARSVGGSNPHLGFFARAGLDRETVDRAVADQEVHELPSARGCTYVLPKADFALGLAVGSGAPEGELAAAVKHLGVTTGEIDRLNDAVLASLGAAPLDVAALKTAVGDAVRHLGDEGRKRGQTTTLPLALGLLQARGQIRRVPVHGRLDEQRFGYVLWSPSPLAHGGPDPDTARTELAKRYFDWAAPASLKHFRWFSGLTAAAAKKAVKPLGLLAVGETGLLLPPDLADAFEDFTVPREPAYALVAGIDGIHLLHRELSRLLDPSDAGRPSPGSKSRTLADEPDPPCPVIVDRGRIAGLWEYDPEAGEIAWLAFGRVDAALKEAVSRAETFVQEQLGDVRMSSLDSPRSRAPRIDDLRSAR